MSFEKNLQKIIEAYVINPDVYAYSYAHCEEYKAFIDNLSDENRRRFDKARTAFKVSNGVDAFRAGLFHAATFGVFYGAKKLININKKSKSELIAELVESPDFVEVFRTFNDSGLFADCKTNNIQLET